MTLYCSLTPACKWIQDQGYGVWQSNDIKNIFQYKIMDEVKDYKYMGNIISSIKSPNQDALKKTYQFLCDQARKAIFSMKTKIKAIGELPPDLMLNLFDTLIKPILIYGSDVRGIKSKLWGDTDKVFLQYDRCILRVKATTSNIISVGEYGRLPPSTACHISALCFMNRLHHMSDDKLVKKVYCKLRNLNSQGFTNWATDALKLVNYLDLNITEDSKTFTNNCKQIVRNNFVSTWFINLHDLQLNPILRTYRTIKFDYSMEPYLYLVIKAKYRHSIAKLRCSSQLLEIERGRHTSPKTPVAERKCPICKEIDGEKHFVLECHINKSERDCFFNKLVSLYNDFMCLDANVKFIFIMTNCDPQCLNWLGKFYTNLLEGNMNLQLRNGHSILRMS